MPFCIVLVANYVPDAQPSMLRFAGLMESGLQERGVFCVCLRPQPFFRSLWKPRRPWVKKVLGYLDKYGVFPWVLRFKVWRLSRTYHRVCVHICDHSNALYLPFIGRALSVVTCHDLLAIRSAAGAFSENPVKPLGRLLQYWIKRSLRRSQQVVCVSKKTADDFKALFPNGPGLQVIYMGTPFITTEMPQGASTSQAPFNEGEASLRAMLPAKYILHVGGNQWYKNRLGVLAIYREWLKLSSGAETGLVLAGELLSAELEARLKAWGLGSKVQVLSSLDDATLTALYKKAQVLLFPSLEEGFGWPIIEAQACGCPVATTNQPPMSEIGGGTIIPLARAPQADTEAFWLWAQTSAQALEGFLEHTMEPQKAALTEAAKAWSATFTVPHMVDGYCDVYRTAVSSYKQ